MTVLISFKFDSDDFTPGLNLITCQLLFLMPSNTNASAQKSNRVSPNGHSSRSEKGQPRKGPPSNLGRNVNVENPGYMRKRRRAISEDEEGEEEVMPQRPLGLNTP
jgi:hypothetical protein